MTTKNQCCKKCRGGIPRRNESWCDNPNCNCHQSDSVVEVADKIARDICKGTNRLPENKNRESGVAFYERVKAVASSHLTTLQQTAQQEKEELVSEIKEFLLGGCGKKDCARGQCLTVRVRREAWKEIKAIAQARGISVSDK